MKISKLVSFLWIIGAYSIAAQGETTDRSHLGSFQSPAEVQETVCSQPGVLSSEKFPADSTEVANDCAGAGFATVVRATWWGGYMNWEPGDPEITTFNVRFYDDSDCTPGTLIAEYLEVTPDATHLGNCTDGLPCFRYDLNVDVLVGPNPFWFSVQAITESPLPYPPRFGRLGDEVYDDCGSVWRIFDYGEWNEITDYANWDCAQEFVISPPVPVGSVHWGAVRTLYR